MNFLEHEVPILTSLHSVRRQLAFADRAYCGVARCIEDANRLATNLRDIAFFQEHEAAGDRQQRCHIRGREILIYAQADDRRTALTRHDDALGIRFAYDSERVSALQFGHGLAYGRQQIRGRGRVMVDAMRDDFGIRFRGEAIAQVLELRAQRLVIFDDAVVHDRDPAARNVRVSICRGRNSMSRPAGVRNTDRSMDRLSIQRVLEDFDFADRAQPPQLPVV